MNSIRSESINPNVLCKAVEPEAAGEGGGGVIIFKYN